MRIALRVLVLLLACATATVSTAAAQAGASASPRLRVYIESCNCFNDFIRDETPWVDFVRQPQDADLQILSSEQATGAGGVERTMRFVGAGRLDGTDYELRAVTLPNEPEDTRRRAVLRIVHVALLGFAARAGLVDEFDLRIEAPEGLPDAAPAADPWNLWAFEISANGSLQSEERSRETSWEIGVDADRVTEHWILNFSAEVESETESFDLDDGRRVEASRRERQARGFVAKSLGSHWSVGFDGDMESSTFDNLDLSLAFAPAVEYNLFPYAEYASRQLRFGYSVGVMHARYNEVTLFDRLRETRPRHEVSATLEQREPWGSIESRLEWSQYLHDLGLSRLEFDGSVNLRLMRGLSLQVGGSASRIRDQISLPRRGATPEEVLLRVRELQSGYETRVFVGVSYSFGSIFNNVVNPRFGRGNRGGGGGN